MQRKAGLLGFLRVASVPSGVSTRDFQANGSQLLHAIDSGSIAGDRGKVRTGAAISRNAKPATTSLQPIGDVGDWYEDCLIRVIELLYPLEIQGRSGSGPLMGFDMKLTSL